MTGWVKAAIRLKQTHTLLNRHLTVGWGRVEESMASSRFKLGKLGKKVKQKLKIHGMLNFSTDSEIWRNMHNNLYCILHPTCLLSLIEN